MTIKKLVEELVVKTSLNFTFEEISKEVKQLNLMSLMEEVCELRTTVN